MIIGWRSIPGNIICSPNWKTQRDPKFGATGKNQSSRRVIHVFRFFFAPISKIEYFSLSHRDLLKGPFLSVLIQLILWLHQSNKSYSGSLSSTRKVLILCENIPIRQREGKNKIEQKKRFFLPRGRNKNGQKSFPSSHVQIEATPIAWRKHVGFTF